MRYIVGIFFIHFLFLSTAQDGVGIGTENPDASAVLEIAAPGDPKGVLIPSFSTTERNNIASPANGLIIYNTTQQAFNYYTGTAWVTLIAFDNVDPQSTGRIRNLQNGIAGSDAVNLNQLNTVDGNNLDRDGSEVMTGDLNMGNNLITAVANATTGQNAVNLNQLNAVDANNLDRDGTETMTGNLNMGNNRITNLNAPVNNSDAVRKADVDSRTQVVDFTLSQSTQGTNRPRNFARTSFTVPETGNYMLVSTLHTASGDPFFIQYQITLNNGVLSFPARAGTSSADDSERTASFNHSLVRSLQSGRTYFLEYLALSNNGRFRGANPPGGTSADRDTDFNHLAIIRLD